MLCGRKIFGTLVEVRLGATCDSVVGRTNTALSSFGLLFGIDSRTRGWLLQTRRNVGTLSDLIEITLSLVGSGRCLLFAASSHGTLQRLRLSSSNRLFRQRWHMWTSGLSSIDLNQIIVIRKLVAGRSGFEVHAGNGGCSRSLHGCECIAVSLACKVIVLQLSALHICLLKFYVIES